jgi:acetyl-CoA decarbonylase/synthase complex subunit gamma
MCTSGNAEKFAEAAKLIVENCDFSLILCTEDPTIMKSGVDAVGAYNPLMYTATEDNYEEMGRIALEAGVPLAVKADGVDGVKALTPKLAEMGLKDLVLDTGARELKQAVIDSVAVRRAALMNQDRDLGYPTIFCPCMMTDNLAMQTTIAAALIAKYAGLVVLGDFEGSVVFPLLLERLNIFTDPQRPMVVTQGIYDINGPGKEAPIMVTSNFSLTYFIVSGEVEGSRVPSWLLIKDTEGLSVLTAWAAGKFGGDDVGMFVKKCGIMDKCDTRKLIIPGYAAAIMGDLEEELPDWEIVIGPREAAHLPKFLKEFKAA